MPAQKRKILTLASGLTLGITLLLFCTAAVLHGPSKELLLEAGVFLISLKLVISTQKSELAMREILERLADLERSLGKR